MLSNLPNKWAEGQTSSGDMELTDELITGILAVSETAPTEFWTKSFRPGHHVTNNNVKLKAISIQKFLFVL